ncbi:hypothetical protein [Faecalibacillus intestinalis]|uniref:hypothetical protein n=1 Tax=Faecalibacillus intestinalis TaxID=1982626 RepID=UPI00352242C7
MNCILKIEIKKFNNMELVDTTNNLVNEFIAVGQFDQIKFHKLNFDLNEGILKQIYFDYLNLSIEKKVNDLQVIYCCPANEDFNYDNFENDSNWNYQFLSFIEAEDFDIEVYKDIDFFKSLDRNNYIGIFKTDTINEGYEKIARLHFDQKQINRTFTMMIINNKFDEKKTKEDIIDFTINFKVNNPERLKSTLKTQLGYEDKIYYILGNSDLQINFCNVLSDVLVNAVNKIKCAIEENDLKQNIRYVHSSVKVAADFSYYENVLQKKNNEKMDYKKAIAELKSMVNNATILDNNEKKYYSTINGMLLLLEEMYYENSNNKYIILAVLPVLYECYIILNKAKNNKILNGVLESVSQTLQVYAVSNFKTGHTPLCISNLYFAPVKLISFYNSYLRMLTLISNFQDSEIKVRYEFLILPRFQNTTNIQTFESIQNKLEDRMLVVYMPSESLFDLQNSLIILTHEAGHYLPNRIRWREERTKFLIKSTISTIYQLIKNNVEYEDRQLDIFNKKLSKYCLSILKKVKNSFEEQNNENKDYLVETEKSIRNSYIENIQNSMFDFLKDLTSDENDNSNISLIKYDNIYKKIGDNIFELINPLSPLSISEFYSNYEYLLRECYSDLFAIELLGLDVQDYVNAFANSFSDNYLNDRVTDYVSFNNKVLNRIAAVLYCENWNIDKNNIFMNKNDINVIKKWIDNQKNIEKNNVNSIEDDGSLIGMQVQSIRCNFIDYLRKCKVSLENVAKENSKLKMLYNDLKNNNHDLNNILSLIDQIVFENENYFSDVINEKKKNIQ